MCKIIKDTARAVVSTTTIKLADTNGEVEAF